MNSPNHSSGLQALETIEAATENVCSVECLHVWSKSLKNTCNGVHF